MAETERSVTWRVELYRLRRLLRSSEETTLLLEEASGKKMAELLAHLDEPVDADEERTLTHLIEGRQAGVPLQHLGDRAVPRGRSPRTRSPRRAFAQSAAAARRRDW